MDLHRSLMDAHGIFHCIHGPAIGRKRNDFPKKIREKTRQHSFSIFSFCWFCHFWVILMVNIIKRIARKLRIIILLHFGLVTCRFAYWRDRKPLISMISGFFDVSMTPKTNDFYLWRHQDTLKNPRKYTKTFSEMLLLEIASLGHRQFWKFWNRRVPKTPNDPSLTLLSMGSISSRKHEMAF